MSCRDWVTCPICGEPDMRRETDDEGHSLIFCVNNNCASNGGDSDQRLPKSSNGTGGYPPHPELSGAVEMFVTHRQVIATFDPARWQLTPKEPTHEMVEAVFDGCVEDQSVQSQKARRNKASEDFKKMLMRGPRPVKAVQFASCTLREPRHTDSERDE